MVVGASNNFIRYAMAAKRLLTVLNAGNSPVKKRHRVGAAKRRISARDRSRVMHDRADQRGRLTSLIGSAHACTRPTKSRWCMPMTHIDRATIPAVSSGEANVMVSWEPLSGLNTRAAQSRSAGSSGCSQCHGRSKKA
jgi:hypothetical protein